MTTNIEITPLALVFTASLVGLSLILSYHEDLSFEKDIITAFFRAVIQLLFAGFILTKVFDIDNILITIFSVLFMIINAAWNASKRGKEIENSFLISFISIAITTSVILIVLLVTKALNLTPSQIVPLSGMIAGNSMSAIGISFKTLTESYADNSQEIQEKLALGANVREASNSIILRTIKKGLIPVLDQSKTTGLVLLPGMMTGLLFAGVDPLQAILYQIMIMFVFISTTGIAIFIATLLAYRKFFSQRMELK